MDAGTESIMDESRQIQNARQASDWRLIAERASKETDPEKLISLVLELSRALEEQQRKRFTSDLKLSCE